MLKHLKNKEYEIKIKKFTRFAVISLISVFIVSFAISSIVIANAATDPTSDDAYKLVYLMSRSEEFKQRHNALKSGSFKDESGNSYSDFCSDHYDTNNGKDCWWINSDGYWGWGSPYTLWIAPFKDGSGNLWAKNGFTVKKPSREDGTLKMIVGEDNYNSVAVGGTLVSMSASDMSNASYFSVNERSFATVWAKGICENGDSILSLAFMREGATVADITQQIFSLKNYKSNETTYSGADGGLVTISHSGYYGTTIFWASLALKNAYNVTKAAGITLMVLYFIIGLLSEAQMSEVTAEMLIKKLLGFAIAVLIISHGFEIISAILEFGESMLSAINGATSSSIMQSSLVRETLSQLYAHRANSGQGVFDVLKFYFWQFGQTIAMAGPALVQLFCMLAIYVMGFGRIFELYARIIFAPIGLAPMVNGGIHSSGIRYLKKIGSLAIQGAVVIACISGLSLVDSFVDSVSFAFFPRLVAAITAIGIVKNSSRISDDIMGV